MMLWSGQPFPRRPDVASANLANISAMSMQKRPSHAGFTVIELIMVMALLGILSAYAVMRNVSPAEVTLPSQAQKMASDIRHAQTLASTWGRRLRISTDSASYSVTCTSSVVAPCPAATTTPVTDPATGAGFSVSLQKGAVFVNPTTATLDIDSLGQPLSAATFTLSAGSTETIAVTALTGFVTVTP